MDNIENTNKINFKKNVQKLKILENSNLVLDNTKDNDENDMVEFVLEEDDN